MSRLLLILFVFISSFSFAQNVFYADSLVKALTKEKSHFNRSVILLALAEDWNERDPTISAKCFNEHEDEVRKITNPGEVADIIIKRSFYLSNKNDTKRMKRELDSIKVWVNQSKNEFLTAKYFFANANLARFDHKETDEEHKKIIELLKKSVTILQNYDIEELAKAQYGLVVFYYNETEERNELNKLLNEFSITVERLTKPRLKAKYFSTIGFLHAAGTGRESESLSFYLKALKYFLVSRDSLSIGSVKITIGNKTLAAGYKDEGLRSINDGIRICERNGYLNIKKADQSISAACSKLGSFYAEENLKEKSFESYKKSIYYNNKAGNFYNEPLLLGNMGLAYTRFSILDTALIIQKKALELRKKFGNKEGELFSYTTLAEICIKKNEYDSAIVYSNKALELANKTKRHSYDNNSFYGLYLAYEKLKDFEKSIFYLNKFHNWTDSVNALKKTKEIDKMIAAQKEELAKAEYDKKHAIDKAEIEKNQLLIDKSNKELLILEQENNIKAFSLEQAKTKIHQNKLETEYHEKEIDFLNAEKKLKDAEAQKKEAAIKQQQTVIYSVSFGGFIVLLLLIIAIRAYRQKQKDNKLIEQQKAEVESQKHLVDEKNKEILDSISYAKRLQDAILPPITFVNTYLPDNFVLYKPKDIVAGDFYWMETIQLANNEELILIAAADSTGHGVPGAMVSLVCSSALNRSVKEFGLKEPGIILDKARELVLETFVKSTSEVKDGMDISLLSIHRSSNKKVIAVKWSGANNPLWYIENNVFKEIKANKQPIGKTDNPVDFLTHELICLPDTIFYLFTDGFPDQFGGPKGKKFKYKQLHELLLSISKEETKNQTKILDQTFMDWKGDLEQVDDVCIIGVRL